MLLAESEIMSFLAPEGPVYQAGTLVVTIAMSAGYAMLKYLKSNPETYQSLNEKTVYLRKGMEIVLETRICLTK